MTTLIENPAPSHWDTYVEKQSEGSFSHLHGWLETLSDVYNLRGFRLATIDNGQLSGLLPLLLFPAPGADIRLISLPYSDATGILADTSAAATVLTKGALDLAERLKAYHVEIRQAKNVLPMMLSTAKAGWNQPYAHGFKTGLTRLLPRSTNLLWSDVGPKVRNQIRKAEKCGCSATIGGIELLEDFYEVFSENMRDLGSPIHSYTLLQQCVTRLTAQIFMIYLAGVPAAGAIVFVQGNTLFNPWASSLRRFRPKCPNMLLYWTMLAYGTENGYNNFDFGRSTPGASTCRFKQQWGAKKDPLTWYVFSRKGRQWSPHSESLVHKEWKKMDLSTSQKKGPALRRWISL